MQNVQKLLRTLKSGDEKQKPENLLGASNKKAELTLLADKDGENKRVDNPKGIRFMAEVNKSRKDAPEKRYVELDSGNLNLRSAPGTINSVLDKIPNGTEVGFTGNIKTVDGEKWAEIEYNGKKGWVAEEYLKTTKQGSFDLSEVSSDTVAAPATLDKHNSNTNVDDVGVENKIQTRKHNNEYGVNPVDGESVRKEFSDVGDFDKNGEMHCVDLTKWFVNSFTTLNYSNGNGCDQVYDTAKLNNVTDEIKTTPCAPSIFSVKGGTYGPGIKEGSVSDAEAGHTGVVVACEYIGNGKYSITYIDTYNGYDNGGYKANLKTKTFDESDNVTYLNLSKFLK